MLSTQEELIQIAVDIKELKQKKDDQNLDKLKVYVIDCETTGLGGHPRDLILSIGISEVDVINQTVDPFYNRVLGYDIKEHENVINEDTWIFNNSPLSLEDIQFAYNNGQKAEDVAKEFNELMEGKWIAMYNKDYDYGKFLAHLPFNLDPSKIFPCLMFASTNPCAIPNPWRGGYKWPALEEAADILLDSELKKNLAVGENYHDAAYDTYVSGLIMLKLIEEGHYDIMEYIK